MHYVILLFLVFTPAGKAASLELASLGSVELGSSPLSEPKTFESINFQPGLNLYQEEARLTDLIGQNGNQLCAPVAITHGFTYLKYQAGFSRLAPLPDMDEDGVADTYGDKIRYFFRSCQTDRNTGTAYRKAIACMKDYVLKSGYSAYAYLVGPHSIEAPPGQPIQATQHVLRMKDFRLFLSKRLLVLMAVGWYSYNPTTQRYIRESGHIVNVYGYDYSPAWGEQQMTLKVVNSWMNYDNRPRHRMYDEVAMKPLPRDGTVYPGDVALELRGPGFNFTRRAFVEDLFIVQPR